MAVFNITGVILLISCTLVFGEVLSTQQEDPTQVLLPQGLLQGKALRSREGKTFYGFMGVPYAQKPNVLEPAAYPPLAWGGTRDATNYGPLCLQFNRTVGGVVGNEDCLLVNVFTPNPKGSLSVIAFIHGGGFQDTWAPENGPEFLLDHDVVFVTFNYRVGQLGFLSTGDEYLPGNVGLKDQNLALRWIQDNIHYFGGDKTKVTLSGQSSGSASVSLHIVSPLSAGLFQRAICQSGSSLDRWAIVDNPMRGAVEVARYLSCPTTSSQALVACLKTWPARDIVESQIASSPFDAALPFGPVVESASSPNPKFLAEHPTSIYEQGRFNKVPLIITTNELEGLLMNALLVLSTPGGADAMNNNWDAVARTAFSIDKPSYSEASKLWATRKLREHYFGSQLVGMDTLLNLANLYSDAGFIYGAKKTALLHAKYAPVYTTMLGFKGIWSVSFEYGFTEIISMIHADDLQYFFTNWRYPTFPPGSDVEEFSKLLTRLWVEYANTGEPNYNLSGRKWAPVTAEEISTGRITWLVLRNQPEFVEEPVRDRMLLWKQIEEVLETGVIPTTDG